MHMFFDSLLRVKLDARYFTYKASLNLTTIINSVQFSRSVMSNSLRPHELQHSRPPCPSPALGVHSNSTSIELVMSSSHLILCRPLLLPTIPPSIRVTGPITSWEIYGKQCQTLFFWAPKSLQMVTSATKLKNAYSLEGKL